MRSIEPVNWDIVTNWFHKRHLELLFKIVNYTEFGLIDYSRCCCCWCCKNYTRIFPTIRGEEWKSKCVPSIPRHHLNKILDWSEKNWKEGMWKLNRTQYENGTMSMKTQNYILIPWKSYTWELRWGNEVPQTKLNKAR